MQTMLKKGSSNSISRNVGYVAIYSVITLVLTMPLRCEAQTDCTVSHNPVNPIGLGPVVNYPRIINHGGDTGEGNTAIPLILPFFDLSAAYQFLDDRSRTGGVSLDSESAVADLTITDGVWPFTNLDISYGYSYASGSSPNGTSETANQHVGSLRILQPFDWLWNNERRHWLPVTQKIQLSPLNFQNAIILEANYGAAFSSFNVPHSPSLHGSAYPFVGNALYDLQLAWFPGDPCLEDAHYPNLLFEFASGGEFTTVRLDSSSGASATTSSSRQITYRNILSVTYSFCCHWGVLLSAEWDAPLYSDPLRGSRPYYANTGIFTARIVYNLYSERRISGSSLINNLLDRNRWSLSLLYSYTAFDPLDEINQFQIQASFAF